MSTTEKIMALIEAHRTAGGREEHAATKALLQVGIEALVRERNIWQADALRFRQDALNERAARLQIEANIDAAKVKGETP